MVVVGEKVRFNPFEYDRCADVSFYRKDVIGEIVEVNYKHKWFSVEYGCPTMRTSFNFCDIGSVVTIIG